MAPAGLRSQGTSVGIMTSIQLVVVVEALSPQYWSASKGTCHLSLFLLLVGTALPTGCGLHLKQLLFFLEMSVLWVCPLEFIS